MLTVFDIYEYFLASGANGKTVFEMLEKLCPDKLMIEKDDDGMSLLDFGLVIETDQICSKMCEDCFLLKTESNVFIGSNKYIGIDLRGGKSREALENFSFDCKYRGFSYTRDLYLDSVRPIVGTNMDGNPDSGTVFKVSPNVFVTAKHCVADLNHFNVIDSEEKPIRLKEVILSENVDLDIALIVIEESVSGRVFHLSEPHVLEDIMVMGYPPISGMLPVLISEKGQMVAAMKSTIGTNVGETKDYLRNLDCFLISARVKGGSSGSPVINEFGKVCGIVVSLPNDIKNPDRIDLMGYGACLPSIYIEEMLRGENIRRLALVFDEKGYRFK
jgi:serine protease Do